MKLHITIAIIFVSVLFANNALFIVDETEQVVLTQFGRPVGDAIREPGLYFKIPFVQEMNVFPKNLLEWDGDPGQVPTKDKTYLWINTFARWRIIDPLKFFETVNNERAAQARLDDILDATVRNFVTSYPLIESVRMTNRELDTFDIDYERELLDKDEQKEENHLGDIKVGRSKITKGILKEAKPKLAEFGIEVLDVKFKRINYVEEVRKSVYGRMIAERKQIAEKFRSEGKGEARKIEGEMEKELKRINSEAYKTAQELMGEADAEVTSLYANAFSKDPEFYQFVKTLEIYEETLDEKNQVILSTDSAIFRYLKDFK